MARKLTPERQKLKQEALSLRYDYGWSGRRIAARLDIARRTIDSWVGNNSHKGVGNNSSKITHLEGDCLELLKDIPDGSVGCLLTDPPYSVMEDYDWDKKDDEFYRQWLSLVKPKWSSKPWTSSDSNQPARRPRLSQSETRRVSGQLTT